MKLKTMSFASVVQKTDKLKEYLRSQDIRLHPSSILTKAMGRVHQVFSFYNRQEIPEGYDAISSTRDMTSLWYLSDMVIKTSGTSFEEKLSERLVLLSKGDPRPLTKAKPSNERDLVFELICAAVCSFFASDVEFGEPDVLATFEGKRWGLACKAVYGQSSTAAKAIYKGEKQIEESDAELGIVVVQLTNIFPHHRMYTQDSGTGEITTFHNLNILSALFFSLIEEVVRDIENERNRLKRYSNSIREKVRGILYVTQTSCFFRERATMMGGCRLISFEEFGPEINFCEAFNEYFQ